LIDIIFAACLKQALLLSFAVVVLRIARPLLLRQGAGVTYAAWWFVPVLMLTPALPHWKIEPLRVALTTARGQGTASLAAIPLPIPARGDTARWLALWLAGTAVVLAVQTWRQWRLARVGERLPPGSSPALIGLLSPRIALPVDFEQRFTPEERELILAHEAVHRARLDNLWNLLATLALALHWWNPLAWWAARRLQADQELACDATVLTSRPGCGQTYVQALLAAHELVPTMAPIASRWASTHPLVERISMLKNPLPASRGRTVLMGCILAGCAGLGWASQAVTTTDTAAPELKLSLVIAQQVGDRVNRLSLALAGHQGEPMRLDNPGDGSDANPPLALDLTARVVDPGKVQVDAVIWEGRPLAVIARPRLILTIGEPAMVEQTEPGTSRRISLVVVPSLIERH
jgi:beta-lactamase regulating signal transducer with metallopeptidase domain